MFLVEFGAGLLADSTALLADSVDMLGDGLVYGFSRRTSATNLQPSASTPMMTCCRRGPARRVTTFPAM